MLAGFQNLAGFQFKLHFLEVYRYYSPLFSLKTKPWLTLKDSGDYDAMGIALLEGFCSHGCMRSSVGITLRASVLGQGLG